MSSDNTGSENVGVAMALVAAAGLSTGLGAAVVFFPTIVKLASRRVLAGSLGFSAGVMTYVSFVEILTKSSLSFEDGGHEPNLAYIYSTLCFFGGVILMMILNAIVVALVGVHHHDHHRHHADQVNMQDPNSDKSEKEKQPIITEPKCCSNDPVQQLDAIQAMAAKASTHPVPNNNDETGAAASNPDNGTEPANDADENDASADAGDETQQQQQQKQQTDENQRLVTMGLNTAVAIGLHNFPEGLATFVAALADPKVAGVLAFAIAIHNIPEGLCVALPIYYATGNRLKAFLWALLSGASEIVAALFGWALLSVSFSFSDNAYALLFGLVAGMMVIISIRELLPTAHFYDPEDTCVTYSFIGGMAVMAISLVMFQI